MRNDMIWYEWWTICEMIQRTIWYVQNASGVLLNDNENGKCWDFMHYVSSCIGGYPYSVTRVRMRTSTRQAKYHYVLHNAAVTVTNFNGCQQKKSYQSRLVRQEKGSSGVQTIWWAHTRTYGLCVEYMVHIQAAH